MASRWLVRDRPKVHGDKPLGQLRCRMPPIKKDGPQSVLVQVTYPADTSNTFWLAEKYPWFRGEVVDRFNKSPLSPTMDPEIKAEPQSDTSFYPEAPPKGQKYGIVVFSHGLYGSVEMYTQMQREMASLGYIVVALEHEDGSGTYAKHRITGEDIDMIDEEDPDNTDEPDFRAPQLAERSKELFELTEFLQATIKGQGQPRDGTEKALCQVLSFGDPDRFLMMGHSFGGAAAVDFLFKRGTKGMAPYVSAILADVWYQPAKAEIDNRLPVPFIVLLSEEWVKTHNPKRGMWGSIKLAQHSKDFCLGVYWFHGTTHNWISDSNYFLPEWMFRMMGMIGPESLELLWSETAKVTKCALQVLLPKDGSKVLEKKKKFGELFDEVEWLDSTAQSGWSCSGPPPKILEEWDIEQESYKAGAPFRALRNHKGTHPVARTS